MATATWATEFTEAEYTCVNSGVVYYRHGGGKTCGKFGNGLDFTDDQDIKNRWVYFEKSINTTASHNPALYDSGDGVTIDVSASATGASTVTVSQYFSRPLKKTYTESDSFWFAQVFDITNADSATECGLGEFPFARYLYNEQNSGTSEYQYYLNASVIEVGGAIRCKSEVNLSSGSTEDRTNLTNATVTGTEDYICAKMIHEPSGAHWRSAYFEGTTPDEALTRAAAWASGSASALTGYLAEGSLTDATAFEVNYHNIGIGFKRYNLALALDVTANILRVDSNTSEWYAPHFGNANDCGLWNEFEVPDAAGETKNGWTFTLDGGAASTGALYHDHAEFSIKRENSDTKIFGYTHDTDQTITQDSTSKYIFGKFQFDANNVNDAWRYGFFNSTTNDCAINGHSIGSDSTGHFFTCIGGTAGNTTTSTFSVDTYYWLRLEINEGTSYLDVFNASATRSEVDAGRGNGDFASLSRDISSATISCDEVGLRNANRTGANATMTMRGYETEGNAHADHAAGNHDGWYPDVMATANTKVLSSSTMQSIDMSTFTATENGTPLYQAKIDTNNDASLDLDYGYADASGTAAKSDVDGYRLGWDIDIDPTETSATVTALSIEHDADSIAPTVDYLKVYRDDDTDFYVLGVTVSDNDNIDFGEFRISDDDGTTWYIVDWDGTNRKKVPTAFASYNVVNSVKMKHEDFTGTIPTPICYIGNVIDFDLSKLGYASSATLTIQCRAKDIAGNYSGWVTATEFSPGGSGTGSSFIQPKKSYGLGIQ